ncbi:FkbM family methyltransferase [Alphaproteobacteria bacterium]|nr:FkbM family methyltransferase [Alphaproteobacteria bacterium]
MPLSIADYEQMNPVMTVNWEGTEVIYSTPTTTALNRVETLPTKEPDTIGWIERFKEGEIFVDIGANIGIYSIWAALSRQVSVFAFEPESQNYGELNKNIFYNDLSPQVRAYCVALSNQSGFDDLHLSGFAIGSSCHSFGEEVDFNLEPTKASMVQGCYSTTLDELVAKNVIPIPHHIKIDVDGIEHLVVQGAMNVFANPQVKSLLVELNTNLEIHRSLVGEIVPLGFELSYHERDAAIRKEGKFKGIGNHIFWRHTNP